MGETAVTEAPTAVVAPPKTPGEFTPNPNVTPRPNKDMAAAFEKFKPAAPAQAAPPELKKEVETPVPVPPVESNGKSPVDDDLARFKKPEPPKEVVESKEPAERVGEKKLREAYEKLKSEYEGLKAKIPSDIDPKALQSKLEEITKKNQELESVVERADFQSSPQFNEKYIKPWQEELNQIAGKITEFEKDDGDGNKSQMTYADFEPLLKMKYPKAVAAAKEMFGDSYALAIGWREQLLRRDESARNAIKNFKEEKTKIDQEINVATSQLQSIYESEGQRLDKEYDHLFVADSKDTEASELVEKGREMARVALFGDPKVGPEQRMKIAAKVLRQSGAYQSVLLQRDRANTRVKELESELAKIRGNGPGNGGQPTGGAVVNGRRDVAADLSSFLASKRAK